MVDGLIVTVPDAGRILLRGRNIRISVKHIQNGVCRVRQVWNTHPRDNLASCRIVFFQFVIQLGKATWIGTEDDVVSVWICDMTAVVGKGQISVRCIEKE